MSKIDKFKTGSVKVQFKKDLPYLDQKGTAIKALKEPQFKSGDKVTLTYRNAGRLTAAGYCDILDEKGNVVQIKTK